MGSQPLTGKLKKEEEIHADKVANHFFHFLMNRNLQYFDARDIP